MKAFYDVIVLGPAVAGRVAAALLAREGYRVLILDGPVGPGAGLPSTGIVTGLDSPAAASIFGTIGLDGAVRKLLRPRSAAWQIACPRLRLDVPLDDDALEQGMRREQPSLAAPAARFFAQLAELRASLDHALAPDATLWPRGLLERARIGLFGPRSRHPLEGASAKSLLDDALLEAAAAGDGATEASAAADATLRAAMMAPVRFLARVLPPGAGEPSAVAAARALDALRRSSASIEGGAAAVGAALAENAGRHGAELVRGAAGTPLELVHRRARTEGIRTAGSGDLLGASVVLAGCELRTIQALCPGRATHARMRKSLASMRPASRVLAIPLTLPPEALPPGLGPLLFAVADPEAPLDGANCLRIERTGTGLLVSCLAPAGGEGEAPEREPAPAGDGGRPGAPDGQRDALRRAVLAALEEPCPFIGRHLRDPGPLVETGQTIFRAEAPPLLGAIGPMPDTGLDDVWAAGPELAPGLDLEGDVLAGAALAARVAGHLGPRVAARPASPRLLTAPRK